jgi:periplasmic copper chaperone A
MLSQRLIFNFTILMMTLALSLTLSHAQAHSFSLDTLDIAHPYTVVTMPGQANGGVFFKHIANKGDTSDRLISASVSPTVAASTELHVMSTDNDIMRMRQVEGIAIPAKTTVPMTRGLKKDGYHVMLMNLKTPLKEGEKIPLKLKFERAGEIEVVVNVETLKADAAPHKH